MPISERAVKQEYDRQSKSSRKSSADWRMRDKIAHAVM